MPKLQYTEPLVIKLSSAKAPVAVQRNGRPWIFWGEKNDYFNYLLSLFNQCPKHSAIVNGKTKYIAGGGWGDKGKTEVNGDGETLDRLTYKAVLDNEIYGGEAYEVIWKGSGSAEFRHVSFANVRTNADESEYYYTSKWLTKEGNPVYDPTVNKDWVVYKPFNPAERGEPQLLVFKEYNPGMDIYPLPEYEAGKLFIELEYQIANYWYSRVKNGFMPSAILNFYAGNPSEDEKKTLEEKIKAKFAGTDNAGQFILNFASNKDRAADIQQITPPELGTEYEALNTTLQTEIFTAHGITSGLLFGIKTPGQLGGRTEMLEANELLQNRYITPKQTQREQFYNQYIFPYIKGLKGDMKLQQQKPIGYEFSESTLVKYLPDEVIAKMVAEKFGVDISKYPPISEKINKEKKEANQSFATNKGEKILLERLKKKAKKRKGEVLYSRSVTVEMAKDLKASEEEIRMTFAKEKNPIIIGGTTPIGKPIDMPKARPTETISVVYKYDWIPGFDDSNLSTSREFCQEMIALTRAGETWTREDIEGVDNETNDPEVSDAWESRGGWWNQNGVAVPHCRHNWVQQVIREIH